MYLVRLEKALQSIPGCDEVMMPFWDETSERSRTHGLPEALTWDTFVLDGVLINNPLKSYKLPKDIII